MSQSEFSTPINQRYFEDYIEGAIFEYGPVTVNEAEIIDFAERFDPQEMHIDPQAAQAGPFKGLIASGWHTIGLMMRLFVDNFLSSVASLASPGIDELRWLKPVRPGDQLRLRVSILETRRSRSKPDRGMVISLMEVINQDGAIVASLRPMNLLGLRNPNAPV